MSVLTLFLKRFIVHIFSFVAIVFTLIDFGLFINLFSKSHDENVLAARSLFICMSVFTIFIDIMFVLCFIEFKTAYLEKTRYITEITQRRNINYNRVAGDEKSGGVAGRILDSKAGFEEYRSYATSNAYKNDSGYSSAVDYASVDYKSFDIIKEHPISQCLYGFIAVFLICSGVIISGPIGLIFIAVAVGFVIRIALLDWNVACSYNRVYKQYLRSARETVIQKQYEIAEEYRKRGINASKIGLRCNNCGNKVFSINGREVVCSYCNNAIKINTL